MKTIFILIAAAVLSAAANRPASAGEQNAIDGCIDRLGAVGGPDGRSVTVVGSEFSEAATLVTLRDAGGTVWRCLAYSDGTVGEIAVAEGGAADDGGGAMAGAPSEPQTTTRMVRFAPGSTGTRIEGTLSPGSSARYVLGARNGQFLAARVDHRGGPRLDFQIFNPDGSFLLDLIPTDRAYRGQLWQSGEHVVEVVNRGNADAAYTAVFTID